MEQTECSETLAYEIQTPGSYPEQSIRHSEQGGSLKSSIINIIQEAKGMLSLLLSFFWFHLNKQSIDKKQL